MDTILCAQGAARDRILSRCQFLVKLPSFDFYLWKLGCYTTWSYVLERRNVPNTFTQGATQELPSRMELQIRLRLIFTSVLAFCLHMQTAIAQQQYNNVTGYTCTGACSTCQSYAFYRTRGSQKLKIIASLFNTSAAGIANASGIYPALATGTPLPDQTPLYVPITCNCFKGIYQVRTRYLVVPQDTMLIIAKRTYQGLTTYSAIQAANPTVVVKNMSIGQMVNIPLRCACPSTQQTRVGSRFLLSYSIFPLETIYHISERFSVSVSDLEDANGVTGQMALELEAFSTLLIPLAALVPLNSSNFASPIHAPFASPVSAPSFGPAIATSKDASKRHLYIGIPVGAVGVALAAILACVLCATVRHYRKNIGVIEAELHYLMLLVPHRDSTVSTVLGPIRIHGNDSSTTGFIPGMTDVVASEKPWRFSYEELLTATNHFSDEYRIQGSAFVGKLNGSFVAIKQMKGIIADELKILSQVHHGNVVRLIGVSASRSESLYFVFEYAENGSLSDCLHCQIAYPGSSFSRSVGVLSWKLRVQIALDVASGLEYLHDYTNHSLVHMDVRTSNILLDGQFRAKVVIFDMTRTAKPGQGGIMTEDIVGMQGYMAPEYFEHGLVTTRADVFSFGVVLLEMLSGREAVSSNGEAGHFTYLSTTVFDVLSGDEQMAKLQAWMDSRIQNAYPQDIAYSMASLARKCVEKDPRKRPDMKEISLALSMMCEASVEWGSSTRHTTMAVEAR